MGPLSTPPLTPYPLLTWRRPHLATIETRQIWITFHTFHWRSCWLLCLCWLLRLRVLLQAGNGCPHRWVSEYLALSRHSTMCCFLPCRCFQIWSDRLRPCRVAEPAGASRMKWSLKCTLGNTNIGGIACPTALTPQHTVTSWPRSELVSAPTCFKPVSTITFGGFCTVVHPVSSTFKCLLPQICTVHVQNSDCYRITWHFSHWS